MLAVVAFVVLIFDRKAYKGIDYGLLLTFVFFFVLIGNLGRISIIHDTLSRIIEKNVTLTAVLASQVISNVPAAMLLSAFTKKGTSLLVGTVSYHRYKSRRSRYTHCEHGKPHNLQVLQQGKDRRRTLSPGLYSCKHPVPPNITCAIYHSFVNNYFTLRG